MFFLFPHNFSSVFLVLSNAKADLAMLHTLLRDVNQKISFAN